MKADIKVVKFAVPVHLIPGQHATLMRRAALQSLARATFWRTVRAGLGASGADLRWPAPKVDRLEMKEVLSALVGTDDLTGRNYVERVAADEMRRLKGFPARVDWGQLQPEPELEVVAVPNRPFVVKGEQLLLPDLVIDLDAFTLPEPFRTAALVPGAERLVRWRHDLGVDLDRWGSRNLSDTARQQIRRHVEQYAGWCTGEVVAPPAVPGVCAVRASLLRQPGPDGVRRWTCILTFTLTSAAIDVWIAPVTEEGPIGIDPGMRHPFTCESSSGTRSSPQALIDFSGLPGLAVHGSGARALRRVCWSRHELDYQQSWQHVLQHRLIRVERTNWRSMVKCNAEFVDCARTNFMWVWLDHLTSLATLGGRNVELISPEFTSRTCSACAHVAPKRQQRWFVCSRCKFRAPVDVNAARNVRLGGCPRPGSA
ncbi:zinc ribbon domain-containing protein [Deinococcus radiomollis]|uniref:zinc ribbon domain-containing protein n=1 Tax=Deinococcus radiomollis TaxID=468916 RepID=UPI00389183D9